MLCIQDYPNNDFIMTTLTVRLSIYENFVAANEMLNRVFVALTIYYMIVKCQSIYQSENSVMIIAFSVLYAICNDYVLIKSTSNDVLCDLICI